MDTVVQCNITVFSYMFLRKVWWIITNDGLKNKDHHFEFSLAYSGMPYWQSILRQTLSLRQSLRHSTKSLFSRASSFALATFSSIGLLGHLISNIRNFYRKAGSSSCPYIFYWVFRGRDRFTGWLVHHAAERYDGRIFLIDSCSFLEYPWKHRVLYLRLPYFPTAALCIWKLSSDMLHL